MDPLLKAQLKEVCSIAFTTSTANSYGEVSVASAATFFCRLEDRMRSYERQDGTFQLGYKPLLILDNDVVGLTFNCRIWLPGDSSSTPALAVKPKHIWPVRDENGAVDHWELWM